MLKYCLSVAQLVANLMYYKTECLKCRSSNMYTVKSYAVILDCHVINTARFKFYSIITRHFGHDIPRILYNLDGYNYVSKSFINYSTIFSLLL